MKDSAELDDCLVIQFEEADLLDVDTSSVEQIGQQEGEPTPPDEMSLMELLQMNGPTDRIINAFVVAKAVVDGEDDIEHLRIVMEAACEKLERTREDYKKWYEARQRRLEEEEKDDSEF